MIRENILDIITLSIITISLVGCSKERQDAVPCDDIVKAVITGCLAPNDGMLVDITKTTVQYDSDTLVKEYPVFWESGDSVYSFAQSGVYMNYVIKPEDIDATTHNARIEILYRAGDSWVTAYHKGRAIGGYVGLRQKDRIAFESAIPREQNGRFNDYHICIAQNNPAENFTFINLQAYARFEITGKELPGRTLGQLGDRWIDYITVEDISDKKMAGNMIFENMVTWQGTVEDSGDDADKVIKVKPYGEAHFSPNKDYFVAIPARPYSKGIRLKLWATKTGGGYECLGYVESSSFYGKYSQILNCFDLLEYVVVNMTDMKVYFDGNDVAGSTITVAQGHTARLTVTPIPTETTNPSILWELVPATTKGISLNQNGEVTGVTVGTGYKVRATSRDTGLVVKEITVNVVKNMPASSVPDSGGYEHETFGW